MVSSAFGSIVDCSVKNGYRGKTCGRENNVEAAEIVLVMDNSDWTTAYEMERSGWTREI
jgi:hypothetical protein